MAEPDFGAPVASVEYVPRLRCRLQLHQGPWTKPYKLREITTTTIGGDFPRESVTLISEEQHQDRTCIHCGAVETRRLK